MNRSALTQQDEAVAAAPSQEKLSLGTTIFADCTHIQKQQITLSIFLQINQASARMVVESFSFYQTGQSKLQKGPQQHVHVYASTHGSNYSLTYLSKSRAHFGFSWSIMNHCAWPMPAEDAPKGHYHFDIPGLRYFFQQMVKEPHDCAVGCRK